MSKQVTCINKVERFNPHERIQFIGGSWGKVSQADAIKQIEADKNAYHVKIGNFDVKLIIGLHNGNKYVRTESDTTTRDNLLYLPACP